MKIIVGSDQMGYPLKQAVVRYLENFGIEVMDVGTFSGDQMVDYPDFAQLVAQQVTAGAGDSGVAICGTGIGMSIAANKVAGIRAALCHDTYTAHQARAHNDANVLCMGAWVVTPQRVAGILEEWLATKYEGGRHQARVAKLDNSGKNSELGERFDFEPGRFRFGAALSPHSTVFGPMLFAGEIETGLQAAAEAGLDVVELSLRAPADLPCQHLQSMLSAYGLELSAIATGQSCLHDGMCLTSPDSAAVRATVERLKAYIELASHFGAAVIIGGVRGRLTGSAADQTAQRQGAVEAIRTCAQIAAERNVQLMIEPINRYETNFVNTADEAMQLLEAVGEPDLKLLLDTFHMNIEEVDMLATLRRVSDGLGYIHFADSNRRAPGQGHIPFRAVMQTLVAIGYRGVISAEILPVPDDRTAMQQTAGFFKSLSLHQLVA